MRASIWFVMFALGCGDNAQLLGAGGAGGTPETGGGGSGAGQASLCDESAPVPRWLTYGERIDGSCELFVVDTADLTSSAQVERASGELEEIDHRVWSKDGRSLAISFRQYGDASKFGVLGARFDAGGVCETSTLVAPTPGWLESGPALSSDGAWVAFASRSEELFLGRIGAGSATRLDTDGTPSLSFPMPFAFSPTNDALLFRSGSRLHVLALGEPADAARDLGPAPADRESLVEGPFEGGADGRTFFHATGDRVRLVDTATGASASLNPTLDLAFIPSGYVESGVAWALHPAEEGVVFLASGWDARWVPRTGGEPVDLSGPGRVAQWFAPSPTSDAVALFDGQSRELVVAHASAAPTPVAVDALPGLPPFYSNVLAWTPDGRAVLVAAYVSSASGDGTGVWQFALVPYAPGPSDQHALDTPLVLDGATTAWLAPDGSGVLYATRDARGGGALVWLPLDEGAAGEPEVVLSSAGEARVATFVPDGSAVFVLAAAGSELHYVRLRGSDEPPQLVYAVTGTIESVVTDGSMYAFAARDLDGSRPIWAGAIVDGALGPATELTAEGCAAPELSP